MKYKQSILITGCSSGIGFNVANDLNSAGYQVFAGCRKATDVDRLKTNFPDIYWLQLDVTDNKSIELALNNILQITHGRLDAVFHNAGFGMPGAVEDISKQAILAQFDTNVFGVLELTNKIIPIMREQGSGKIIVNSSILGFISLRYRGAYTASKFALEGLFNTLRLELADSPISVSIIQPGPITSKFRDNSYQNFLNNIDAENSVHVTKYKNMQQKFLPKLETATKKLDLFELPPSAISKRVLKILKTTKPRARYSVTLPTYLFRFLVRILPTKILDQLLYQITNSETANK
jgi:NADP-dependent 3-hydroxy acid dehydrogenase YdfG